jgi:hypothetical protein
MIYDQVDFSIGGYCSLASEKWLTLSPTSAPYQAPSPSWLHKRKIPKLDFCFGLDSEIPRRDHDFLSVSGELYL